MRGGVTLAAITAIAGMAVVLAGVGAVTAPADPLLVVEQDGEELLTVRTDGFVLEYTHSVEKTPVVETYELRNGSLVMTRMEFSSYGAGLPSTADVNRTDDGAFVFEPNAETEELYVSPGEIAGHELVVDGERYDLVELSGGETVRFRVSEGAGERRGRVPWA
ncbi:DUF1850 domain-containing protein [Halorarum salinum]|uniref:DUF1850 domain-containing protein n=1 Tax=Halorarum salinum TaxID=2743089 RepID=A0A7D5L8K6_9EURY|nr:DUF1850 domain-containing protein [Halobaculum salinum]QLG60491.1 DUF1850 domain-containing protein [Halobaculum salinum]